MTDRLNDDQTTTYQKWEVDKLVDDKIDTALAGYDKKLWKDIDIQFQLRLASMKQWISINKFVAVAVGLLMIGTAYQLFISLANIAGLK